MAAKKTGQKSTVKGGKSAKKSESPKGQGFDPKPFYKNVPEGYVATQEVGKATEIRGRPIVLDYDPTSKKGSVTIEDIAGNTHVVRIKTALMFDTIMFFHNEYDNLSKFRTEDKAYRNNMIKRALKFMPRVPLLFRIATDEEGTYVFGVMSDKWRHVKAEDHVDIVKDTLKEVGMKADVKMTKSDGLHGGTIVVTPKDNDGTIQPEAHFDFGIWDGYHKVRGVTGGQVLACSNQISIEVRGLMGKLEIGSFANLNELHAGADSKFSDLVKKVAEAIGAYGTIVDAAKKVKVSKDKMAMIVQYYTDKNVISSKTQALVVAALEDDEIQQMKGTLYGLAMVLTYVGTHNDDIKDGVKQSLRKLGGEILVVSQDAKNYWSIIQNHHTKKEEAAQKKEKEAPAKKEASKEEEAPKEAPVPVPKAKKAKKSKK